MGAVWALLVCLLACLLANQTATTKVRRFRSACGSAVATLFRALSRQELEKQPKAYSENPNFNTDPTESQSRVRWLFLSHSSAASSFAVHANMTTAIGRCCWLDHAVPRSKNSGKYRNLGTQGFALARGLSKSWGMSELATAETLFTPFECRHATSLRSSETLTNTNELTNLTPRPELEPFPRQLHATKCDTCRASGPCPPKKTATAHSVCTLAPGAP